MTGFRFQDAGLRAVMLLVVLLVALPVSAEEAKKEEKTPPHRMPACLALKNEVRTLVAEVNACWKDTDCTSVSLGCPWQFATCDQTIIGLTEAEKVTALSEKTKEYYATCITPDPAMLEACEAFNARVKATKCTPLQVMCVNGTCMTQIDAIMQKPDYGEKLEKGRIAPDDILKKNQ